MLEFMYPILQGYDSVVLKSDIEIGGTDQIFNLLMGRDMQRDFGLSQQVVITMPLLEGTDGLQKMSKSYGNYIGINEGPASIFGKIMSVSDELMCKYYTLLTDEPLDKVSTLHPRDAKVQLAKIIIAQYHPQKSAEDAHQAFEHVFKSKQAPQDLAVFEVSPPGNIIDVISESGLAKSRNEARRLIRQGAVEFQNAKIDDENYEIKVAGILKVGSRRFLRVECR
jgi:tyrosyl-tRNA synthetase